MPMSREFFSRTPAPDEHATKNEGAFNSVFRKIASRTAAVVGSKWAFLISVLVVVVWAATGPIFHFSDTWQLVINTGTTIVTFIMVFLIQSTQNRDSKALHLKIDELIRALAPARNSLVDLEEMSDRELEKLADEFASLHQRALHALGARDERPHRRPRTRRRRSHD